MKNTIILSAGLTIGICLGFASGVPVGANKLYSDMFVGKINCTRVRPPIADYGALLNMGSAK